MVYLIVTEADIHGFTFWGWRFREKSPASPGLFYDRWTYAFCFSRSTFWGWRFREKSPASPGLFYDRWTYAFCFSRSTLPPRSTTGT